MLATLLAVFLLNNGWSFHLGDANSMEADFAHGTQYFTHMAKACAWDGVDATSLDFVEDSTWTKVNLPHDWVVDLPFSPEASHSHGYKCIGWKYPQNSVGWYRRELDIPASAEGEVITVEFEGVYRNYEVYINGFYVGHERSGYATREYDLSDYLIYGGRNILAVRVDASLEEGWYYEGAGIYRNVYLWEGGKPAQAPAEVDYAFSPEQGFLVNGKKVFLKGANIHQDAAGVGIGVPDELWRYRIARLKEFGFNAIRTAHNPASPSLLRICDEMDMYVIEEVRQFGSYPEALELLKNMIERDRHHKCVIAWGIGNEEWGGRPVGGAVARKMVAYAHTLDPSRPTTYGNSGGEYMIDDEVDVPGYNYIRQNHIDQDHAEHPGRSAIGTEETSGAGVRGSKGDFDIDFVREGYEFYVSRPWTAGVFFWTGFDYRGEPYPKAWPNTGSLFGLMDYCGYPKEEMWELRALWSGETKRELKAARRVEEGSLGSKMGQASTKSLSLGSKSGQVSIRAHKNELKRDGQDVIVIDVWSNEPSLEVSVTGAEFLGWGNGDPQFRHIERPSPRPGRASSDAARTPQTLTIYPFVCRAQVLVRSIEGQTDPVTVRIGPAELIIR
ncbi:MAG: hypothetical protein J5748_02240 [Bacteroidales bacterium]|nr:hypothetical protein [Bacteroidales bacterium]